MGRVKWLALVAVFWTALAGAAMYADEEGKAIAAGIVACAFALLNLADRS